MGLESLHMVQHSGNVWPLGNVSCSHNPHLSLLILLTCNGLTFRQNLYLSMNISLQLCNLQCPAICHQLIGGSVGRLLPLLTMHAIINILIILPWLCCHSISSWQKVRSEDNGTKKMAKKKVEGYSEITNLNRILKTF